nr:lipoprotein [Leptospira meyeri]
MNRTPIFLFFLFLAGIQISCKFDEYQVRSTLVINSPKKKLMLGLIGTRDVRTPKSIAKDFQDLLAFELIQKGYEISFCNFQELYKEVKTEHSKLPINLRAAAGEFWNNNTNQEKQLLKGEIKELVEKEGSDFFLQGTVSIQNNDAILERKDYNYIFLHIYGPDGNMVGMIRSTFDNKILYESALMKEVAAKMALEFQNTISGKK